MEDRYIHQRLQFLLHIETVRRLDVFQIDATEGWSEQLDAIDKLLRILRIYADINRFYTRKLIE